MSSYPRCDQLFQVVEGIQELLIPPVKGGPMMAVAIAPEPWDP